MFRLQIVEHPMTHTDSLAILCVLYFYGRYGEFFQMGVMKWLLDTDNSRIYKRKRLGRAVDTTIEEVSEKGGGGLGGGGMGGGRLGGWVGSCGAG